MYAKGDIDGALAAWQEALAIAPDDTRALGYVDYVVSNYQVLRKPADASGESDGIELAGEDSHGLMGGSEPAPNYPRTAVDDGWFLDDDMGAAYAVPADPLIPPAAALAISSAVDEFELPTPTVDAPSLAQQLALGDGLGLAQAGATAPPPLGQREDDTSFLEARLRGARHTLAPGSVPPVAEIARSLRPRMMDDEAHRHVQPDRFLRPTSPPVGASPETLEVTAASIHLPQELDLGLGDTTAQVTLTPSQLEDPGSGPVEAPVASGATRTLQIPTEVPQEAQRTAQFDAVLPAVDEADFGDLERMDLDVHRQNEPSAAAADEVPRPGTYDGDVGDYELELELVGEASVRVAAAPSVPEVPIDSQPDLSGLSPMAMLAYEVGRATAHVTAEPERTRERVSWLLGRAREAHERRDLPAAVRAAELALREAPDSATAQKLIHAQAGALEALFGEMVGAEDRVPRVIVDMEAVMARDIDSRGAFLLSRIDAMSTFEEIVDISGMPRFEALRYLAWFVLEAVIVAG